MIWRKSIIIETFDIYDYIRTMNVRELKRYTPVSTAAFSSLFRRNTPDGIIGKQRIGDKRFVTALPTTIAGRHIHSALQVRTYKGKAVNVYDAVRGFDKYIEGASDVIYHTDNIQRLRILADAIRYRFSDDGTKARVDEIRDNPNIATEEKASLINDIYKEDKTSGSAFVQELEEYTNILANKKSRGDRGMERSVGRGRLYNFAKNLENRSSRI